MTSHYTNLTRHNSSLYPCDSTGCACHNPLQVIGARTLDGSRRTQATLALQKQSESLKCPTQGSDPIKQYSASIPDKRSKKEKSQCVGMNLHTVEGFLTTNSASNMDPKSYFKNKRAFQHGPEARG